MTIRITWSNGNTTTEHGNNPCKNQPEFTAEQLFNLFVTLSSLGGPKPVSYEVVEESSKNER